MRTNDRFEANLAEVEESGRRKVFRLQLCVAVLLVAVVALSAGLAVTAKRLSDIGRLENRGPFLTSPLGANCSPRGEVVPQG
jgi:hypothetical protein